ncbi:Aldo/keto reductase [Tilletiaria anomala UBC 951]|uniref:Aldo/keto reductase n=1 Tax=Tilletiaria anomala (strain ATCC 24038 / CBS 436.72 / UBC 951) TaxID=1037660 RepID=A0A066VQW7_TILAU|nr:Aldo/keto reductase [Tilletiaria anomala UBC 951]KDN40965.1 Aldo/keto reductase [Tilletiaria anomala UBC 951]
MSGPLVSTTSSGGGGEGGQIIISDAAAHNSAVVSSARELTAGNADAGAGASTLATAVAAPAPVATMPLVPRASMSMPKILYGTAWKGDATASLVRQAFRAGFRGVDTAGQRKHYREDLVGEGIALARRELGLKREDIWIQTKFTSVDGQDSTGFIPYDPQAPVAEQVWASFRHSLYSLNLSPSVTIDAKGKKRETASGSKEGLNASSTDVEPQPYIDSYLLHSPLRSLEETAAAWAVLEELVLSGQVRQIGISNVYDPRIWAALRGMMTRVKPTVLQNRWHASTGHDLSVLPTLSPVLSPNDFPLDEDGFAGEGIRYQPFWTLTGNPFLLESTAVLAAAAEFGLTPEQVVYRYVSQGLGIAGVQATVLCGSTSESHVREAVQAVQSGSDLDEQTIDAIRREIYGE